MCIGEGHGYLNKGQRRAVETALIADNKLMLIQGPPGKLRDCFILICMYCLTIFRYWQERGLCRNDKKIC